MGGYSGSKSDNGFGIIEAQRHKNNLRKIFCNLKYFVFFSKQMFFIHLFSIQQQKDDDLVLPEGVKCFTCGLEEINPHADKVRSLMRTIMKMGI